MQLADVLNRTYVVSVLDVLFVSFVIYRILLLVKGTRAQPMLIGLAVLIGVYVLANFFGLVGLTWLLGHFLGSAVVVLVVVLFQEDLRRALIKVGVYPMFGGSGSEEMEHTINEVAKAAQELSSRRLGALIVIQREVGLEEHTETAVRLDAYVSKELLVSIFLPTSPIHDGAVVINGSRIVAAGTVLPLTFTSELGGSLGTRHRAALGLSERTDSVVVVVSEETGIISLVREGKMTRDLNEKTLMNALTRLTIFRQRRVNKLKVQKLLASASRVPKKAESGEKGDSENTTTKNVETVS